MTRGMTIVLYALIFLGCAIMGAFNLVAYGKQGLGLSAYLFFMALGALVLGVWNWKLLKKETVNPPTKPETLLLTPWNPPEKKKGC